LPASLLPLFSAVFQARTSTLDAASIRSDMRKTMKDFGMIDALIVAQQKRMGAELVSGDAHFRELDGVVFV
jgi:predicted nucleic acid-binding protein